MSEQNETVNAPEPVDPAKSTRNKIAVGIFLLMTTIAALAFAYFAAILVKKPLGTPRDSQGVPEAQESQGVPETQDEVRHRDMRVERIAAQPPAVWP